MYLLFNFELNIVLILVFFIQPRFWQFLSFDKLFSVFLPQQSRVFFFINFQQFFSFFIQSSDFIHAIVFLNAAFRFQWKFSYLFFQFEAQTILLCLVINLQFRTPLKRRLIVIFNTVTTACFLQTFKAITIIAALSKIMSFAEPKSRQKGANNLFLHIAINVEWIATALSIYQKARKYLFFISAVVFYILGVLFELKLVHISMDNACLIQINVIIMGNEFQAKDSQKNPIFISPKQIALRTRKAEEDIVKVFGSEIQIVDEGNSIHHSQSSTSGNVLSIEPTNTCIENKLEDQIVSIQNKNSLGIISQLEEEVLRLKAYLLQQHQRNFRSPTFSPIKQEEDIKGSMKIESSSRKPRTHYFRLKGCEKSNY